MTTYTLSNISFDETFAFVASSREELLSALYENMYVLWENTPHYRDWEKPLLAGDTTIWSYHGTEFLAVRFYPEKATFLVWEVKEVI